MQCELWAIPCSSWDVAVQSVLCHQDSTSNLVVVPLYVTVCPIICFKASSHCKRDIDALLWLNAEMLERVPIPLFVKTCKIFRPWVLFCETTVYIPPYPCFCGNRWVSYSLDITPPSFIGLPYYCMNLLWKYIYLQFTAPLGLCDSDEWEEG